MTNKNQQLTKLEYNGIVYTGNDMDDLIINILENSGLTYRAIGKLLHISHTKVWMALEKLKEVDEKRYNDIKSGESLRRKARSFYEDYFSDSEVAGILQISTTTAIKMRRHMFGNDYCRKIINVALRRKIICRKIFGSKIVPGPHFSNFLTVEFKRHLTESQAQTMIDFYVRGVDMPRTMQPQRSYLTGIFIDRLWGWIQRWDETVERLKNEHYIKEEVSQNVKSSSQNQHPNGQTGIRSGGAGSGSD